MIQTTSGYSKATRSLLAFLVLAFLCGSMVPIQAADARWSDDRANAWYKTQPWFAGCNFIPSTAINQLEMWQPATFDPETIDRELGWAEGLGFNCVRVFLHHLPWQDDSKGFQSRLDRFLDLADQHHIKVMFVLLDSCWNPFPKSGRQPAPKPFVHNSGWVQCPGLKVLTNTVRHAELESYVKGVMERFRDDPRVVAWDLFNEPDNNNGSSYSQFEPSNKTDLALALLQKTFAWAREVNPSQPLTVGVWAGEWVKEGQVSPINLCMLENSDVISFHNYGPLPDMKRRVESLRKYNRPLLCTEYMARPAGSTFREVTPYLKDQKVGAMNWGFVAGKSQTIYPWDSWKKSYTSEPPLWFHDIFRPNGSAYDLKEALLIRKLTGQLKEPTGSTKF